MSDPDWPVCPGCEQPAARVFPGNEQAFCGSDDCHVLMWNPSKSLAELAADIQMMELPEAFRRDS